MKKPTKRKAFNFLRSYFDVLNELETEKDKLNFLLSIINKQFLDEDPKDLDFVVNLCYESQRHQIEQSVKGWKRATSDTLGTAPPTTLETTPPTDPKEEEEKGEEEEEEKEESKKKEKVKKKPLEERKAEFKLKVVQFKTEFQTDTLKSFFEYWTESNDGGNKMKFEMQKTFSTKHRLSTWKKNESRFGEKKPDVTVYKKPAEFKGYK